MAIFTHSIHSEVFAESDIGFCFFQSFNKINNQAFLSCFSFNFLLV